MRRLVQDTAGQVIRHSHSDRVRWGQEEVLYHTTARLAGGFLKQAEKIILLVILLFHSKKK